MYEPIELNPEHHERNVHQLVKATVRRPKQKMKEEVAAIEQRISNLIQYLLGYCGLFQFPNSPSPSEVPSSSRGE